MLTLIKNRFQYFWNAGNERSLNVKKNIIYSFLIKGGSILIGLILIPLTIHYIDPVQYGIWLTISSMVGWMNNFDIGLSHGLRNKLAHESAIGKSENSVKYVSTTYAMLLLISAATFLIFTSIGSFFNWNHLLNIDASIHYSIWPLILITLGAFCVQFMLQPINSILIATHKPFKATLIAFIGQVVTLVIIVFLVHFVKADLLLLVIVMVCTPALVLLISNFWLFWTTLKEFSPKFSYIHLRSAKSLLKVGGAFFLIQIGALILYQTDNIVITKTLGPQAVTTFNIAYKIFTVLALSFSIIVTPYWSAFTDAYAKNDISWIKQSLKKMKQIWLYLSIGAILMFFCSKMIYKIWIGEGLEIPSLVSFSMAIYVIAVSWNAIHCYALNGMGKLKLQLIFVLFAAVVNIPLSIFLINRVGLSGTVIANIVVTVINNVIFTRQVNLIITNKAKGIWNK